VSGLETGAVVTTTGEACLRSVRKLVGKAAALSQRLLDDDRSFGTAPDQVNRKTALEYHAKLARRQYVAIQNPGMNRDEASV